MPKIYTVKEVADILGFSTNSIYTFLKEKRIKGVRVGAGRFRIPEEELTRILHLSKKSIIPQQETSIKTPVIPNFTIRGVKELHMSDWFVGMTAIVVGVSLFLFNESTTYGHVISFIPLMRIFLIVFGIGILASNVFHKHAWIHKVFHVLLGVVGIVSAYGLFIQQDVNGVVLYGALGCMVILNSMVRMKSELFIGVYTSILALGTVIGVIFFPGDAHLAAIAQLTHVSPFVVILLISVLALINLSMYWIGLVSGRRTLFIVSCVVAAISFIWTGGLFAQLGFWSRAFYYAILSFFCLLVPVWQQLDLGGNKRQRFLFHLVFGSITVILVLSAVVVFIIHKALWDQRAIDFDHKITMGKMTIESAIESIESSMKTAANNADIIDHGRELDTEGLVRDAKILYESNPLIRRLIFLDATGSGVMLYPHGVFDQQDLSFRDYYIHTKETKKPFLSDIFISLADGLHRPSVTFSVPLLTRENEFIGVMAVSINLEKLNMRLAQIARDEHGEQFKIADKNGYYVIHPDFSRVGTLAEEEAVVLFGVSGKRGVKEALRTDNTLGLVAYDSIPSLGWGISLTVPAANVVAVNTVTMLLMFGTVFGIFVLAVGTLEFFRIRSGIGQGEGS